MSEALPPELGGPPTGDPFPAPPTKVYGGNPNAPTRTIGDYFGLHEFLSQVDVAANGGDANSGATIINPPFHAEHNPPYNKAIGPLNLYRGSITRFRHGTMDPNVILNFMYNPDSIRISYGADPGTTAPELQENHVPSLVPTITMDFTLLFDRVYDRMADPNHRGVFEDLRVLEALGNPSDIRAGDFAGSQQVAYVWVRFDRSAETVFYGQMTSINANVTHFGGDMTPLRMEVGISFQRMTTDGQEFPFSAPSSAPQGVNPVTRPPIDSSIPR